MTLMASLHDRRQRQARETARRSAILVAGGDPRSTAAFVRVFGTIDADNVFIQRGLRELRERSGADEVSVIVDSRGGNGHVADQIYDMLRSHGGRVVCRARNVCASAAVRIFLAGDYREAAANTRFLLHDAAVAPPPKERWTGEAHMRAANALRDLNTEHNKFIAARLGRSVRSIEALMAAEKWIGTDEAVRIGLLHHVF